MELQSQGERGDNGNEVESRREKRGRGREGGRERKRGKQGEGERGGQEKTGQRGRGLFHSA